MYYKVNSFINTSHLIFIDTVIIKYNIGSSFIKLIYFFFYINMTTKHNTNELAPSLNHSSTINSSKIWLNKMSNIRIIKRQLVYVVGLPYELAYKDVTFVF